MKSMFAKQGASSDSSDSDEEDYWKQGLNQAEQMHVLAPANINPSERIPSNDHIVMPKHLMFSVIPLKFQVLYSNCVGLTWSVYLVTMCLHISSKVQIQLQLHCPCCNVMVKCHKTSHLITQMHINIHIKLHHIIIRSTSVVGIYIVLYLFVQIMFVCTNNRKRFKKRTVD